MEIQRKPTNKHAAIQSGEKKRDQTCENLKEKKNNTEIEIEGEWERDIECTNENDKGNIIR